MVSQKTRKTAPALKLLDLFILFFLGLCPVWYILSTLVPFITLTYRMHLDRIPYYLRNAGIILSAAELILCRRLRKGPHVYFLYGICGIALISSLLQGKYGYAANLNTIAWMMIVFVLFYSAACRISRNKFRASVLILFTALFIIWFLATCLSLHQFVHLIGADSPQEVSSLWLTGNGFHKNRLYGIFAFPEYGAVTGLLLMIGLAYLFFRTRIVPLRILIGLLTFPFFWYLLLSGSRNARVSLYASVFMGAFLLLRTHFYEAGSSEDASAGRSRNSGRKASGPLHLKALAGALAALVALHLLCGVTLAVSEKVPGMFDKTKETGDETAAADPRSSASACILIPLQKLLLEKADCPPRETAVAVNDTASSVSPSRLLRTGTGSKSAVTSADPSEVRNEDNSKNGALKTASSKKKDKKKGKKTEQDEEEESLLGRKDVQHNPGTFRMEIWLDYLGLYKDIGLFGLSPENNSKYIQEHYPDLFIVDYIRRAYPDDYERGYVFHPHSGYLKVFVSTGFAGIFLLLIFMILCGANIFFYLKRTARPSLDFLFSFLVVFAGALTAVFDTELFFSINPATFLFWLALASMYRSMRTSMSRESGRSGIS